MIYFVALLLFSFLLSCEKEDESYNIENCKIDYYSIYKNNEEVVEVVFEYNSVLEKILVDYYKSTLLEIIVVNESGRVNTLIYSYGDERTFLEVVEYEGDRISKLTRNYYVKTSFKKEANEDEFISSESFSFFYDGDEIIGANYFVNVNSSLELQTIIEITRDGDNISTWTELNANKELERKYTFVYDKKSNPFKGMMISEVSPYIYFKSSHILNYFNSNNLRYVELTDADGNNIASVTNNIQYNNSSLVNYISSEGDGNYSDAGYTINLLYTCR